MIIQNQFQNSSFPFVVTNSYCFNCEAINDEYEKMHESQFDCQSPSYLSFNNENIDDKCSKNICDSMPKRKLFTLEEDILLQNAVNKYQYKDWSKIAQYVPGRTPKQCRDRWTNYLHPSLKFGPWTHADNLLLVSLVNRYGTHWSKMKNAFPNRSSNSLKNQWNSLIKKHVTIISNCETRKQYALNESISFEKISSKIRYKKEMKNEQNDSEGKINEKKDNDNIFQNIETDDEYDLIKFTEEELGW